MDRITIGRNVRLRRKDLDLSQTEVAKRMGIHRITLAKIETGRASVPLESVPPLLEMLELERMDILFTKLWS